MNLRASLLDFRSLLLSKRASFAIFGMAVTATAFALFVRAAPEELRRVLEAATPGTAGVFEFLWYEDMLSKFLVLIMVSYGSFILCDTEDVGALGLVLSQPETRGGFLLRRTLASLAAFVLVFLAGGLAVAILVWPILGEMDLVGFMTRLVWVLPMCLFVIALTFFLSVYFRTTPLTVIFAFVISLALSFLYTLALAAGVAPPTPLNPMALGYRVVTGEALSEAVSYSLLYSLLLLGAGLVWFQRKDL